MNPSSAARVYCLATEIVLGITDASTGPHLRAVLAKARPVDIDHLADRVATTLHQTWTTAGRVEEWDVEPDEADLAAIEAEWPVLAAELAVVEAQCRFLASPDTSTRRALRRAETARDRTVAAHTHPHTGDRP